MGLEEQCGKKGMEIINSVVLFCTAESALYSLISSNPRFNMMLLDELNKYPTVVLEILLKLLEVEYSRVFLKEVVFLALRFIEEEVKNLKYELLFKYFTTSNDSLDSSSV